MNRLMQTSAIVIGLAATGGVAHAVDKPDFGACNTDYKAVDANDDGTVSVEEARQAAEYEFGRLDRDGNGEISLAEWRNCSGVSYLSDVYETDEAEQAAADDEAASQEQQTTGGMTGDLPTIGEYTEETFGEADADVSGDIEYAEAAQWAEQQWHDREARDEDVSIGEITEAEADARIGAGAFAALDSDQDGTVTNQEWASQDQARSEIRFEKFDADHDDTLTREEWDEAMDTGYSRAQETAQGEAPTVWLFWYAI